MKLLIRFADWLYNKTRKEYTAKEKAEINKFKSLFRFYFEGCYGEEPINYLPLGNFQITDLLFEFKKDFLFITVVLERPGILIGKAGTTIDGLNKYLLRANMEVKIKESKLWSFVK